MPSWNELSDATKAYYVIGTVAVLFAIYWLYKLYSTESMWTGKREGFNGSAPSVILFTIGTGDCSTCSRSRQESCAICQFRRLRSSYGQIKVMHVPDVSTYQSMNVHIDDMLRTGGPLVAYLPEGLANKNLVRVYNGPLTTIAMENWIKSLPFARV
jgi:hypothetical protein